MKRIYLLALLVAGIGADSFAQRVPDLSIKHFYAKGTGTPVLIQDNNHIVYDGGDGISPGTTKYSMGWEIVNHGLTAVDTIQGTDSIKIKSPWGITYTGYLPASATQPAGLGQHDSTKLFPTNNPILITPNPTLPSQAITTTNWCDSVWIGNSPASSPTANETNMSNNFKCNTMIIDVWAASIDDVQIDGSGIIIFPNPVTGKMNFKHNFGAKTDAVVTIVNVVGAVVYKEELKNMSGLKDVPVNINNLVPGMYILRVATNDKISAEKFYIK